MAKVREHVADGRLLALIESFLKQGVMNGAGEWEPSEGGAPQGGVLNSLLANLYLKSLDHEMVRAGVDPERSGDGPPAGCPGGVSEANQMVRYAHNFVCLCKDEASARAALGKVAQWVAEAGLTLHPEKTRILDLGQLGAAFDVARTFFGETRRAVSLRSALGYDFYRGKQGRMKGRLRRRPRTKSVQALKSRLKPLTKRNNGRSLEAIIWLLRPMMCGWFAYFWLSSLPFLQNMDGWVRQRLRGMLRKRQGRRGKAGLNEKLPRSQEG